MRATAIKHEIAAILRRVPLSPISGPDRRYRRPDRPHGEENAADASYRLRSARPHSRRDRGRQAHNDQRYCGKLRHLKAAFDEGRERSQSEGLSRYRARSWRRHPPASPAARHQYWPSGARDRGQARCYRLSGAARLLRDRARLRVARRVARCGSGVSRCPGRIYTGRSDQAAKGVVVVVAARSARGAGAITDSPAAVGQATWRHRRGVIVIANERPPRIEDLAWAFRELAAGEARAI